MIRINTALKTVVLLSIVSFLSGCANSSQNQTKLISDIPSYQNLTPKSNYYAELQKDFKENIRKQLKETEDYENPSAENNKKEDGLFIYKQLMKRKSF